MIGKLPSDQGRARGLYDEQLQRKQQEKALLAATDPRTAKCVLGLQAEKAEGKSPQPA